MIAAGFAAHLGHLSLTWVILIAFAESLSGDEFYFLLGRIRGRTFLEKRPRREAKVKRVWALFEHYRTLLVLGFRFLYGFRTVTPFAIGLGGVSGIRLFVCNIIGRAVWSVAVAYVGYLFGAIAEEKQVEKSPSIDTDKPVSRQHEVSYFDYYGYPYYWSGPYLWGPTTYPRLSEADRWRDEEARVEREAAYDAHLRSANKVTGYHI